MPKLEYILFFGRGYFCCGLGGTFEVEGSKICVQKGVLLLCF